MFFTSMLLPIILGCHVTPEGCTSPLTELRKSLSPIRSHKPVSPFTDLVASFVSLQDINPSLRSHCWENEVMDLTVCSRPPPSNTTDRVTVIVYEAAPLPPASDQSAVASLKREYHKNVTEAIENLMWVLRN